MKKLMIGLVLIGGLTFGFADSNAEAAVQTYMSPSKIDEKTHVYRTITVGADRVGPSSFYFDPGNGQKERVLTGSGSRSFSQYWTSNGISHYTYSGRSIVFDYGPGTTVYGEARISAN